MRSRTALLIILSILAAFLLGLATADNCWTGAGYGPCPTPERTLP